MEDLTGKKYGKLTVIKFIERKDTSYYWLCKCECGNEKIVTASKNILVGIIIYRLKMK